MRLTDRQIHIHTDKDKHTHSHARFDQIENCLRLAHRRPNIEMKHAYRLGE